MSNTMRTGSMVDDTVTFGIAAAKAKTAAGASFLEMAKAAAPQRAESVTSVESAPLETMLKAKYPNLHYHVFDAGSGYWRTRNDYPHYLLYQDGSKAKETLENWQPTGANPFYGSIDGRFTAPKEIHALGSVPPRSKAVVIHPKVQERMEQDPAYAREIYARIEAWFAFDVARNEAHMPGCTWDMSQAVAIGEDGNICNACSSSAGGEITYSVSGDSWWDLRAKRHKEYMRLWQERQLEHQAMLSDQLNAQAARRNLLGMLNDDLLHTLGDTVAGVSTTELFELIRREAASPLM